MGCGHIVEDARGVLNNLRSWLIGHVKRDLNSTAHFLAKEAMKSVMDQIWMEEVPNCILNDVTLIIRFKLISVNFNSRTKIELLASTIQWTLISQR